VPDESWNAAKARMKSSGKQYSARRNPIGVAMGIPTLEWHLEVGR
jgi:hypothetical protein